MMFKVGQEVWIKDSKKKNTIIKIVESGFTKVTLYELENSKATLYELDNYSIHDKSDLHQTADDMFEALGYESYYASATDMFVYHKVDDLLRAVLKIYIPRFDSDDYGYQKVAINHINNHKWNCDISIGEHLAIHQKLIELGYIEEAQDE